MADEILNGLIATGIEHAVSRLQGENDMLCAEIERREKEIAGLREQLRLTILRLNRKAR